jgi:hypothetical protein
VLEAQVHGLADDAGVPCDRGSDQVGRQHQRGVVGEPGRQTLPGQLHSVPCDAREADLQGVALGAHGLDLNRLPWRLGRRDDGLGREVEGDAEDVGVLDVEQALLVQVVGLAAQGAADHLLAEEWVPKARTASSASPLSSCSLSMSRVLGRGSGLPGSSKLRTSASRPCSKVLEPSSFVRRKPETES